MNTLRYSIRRYVMVESASIGLTVHERQAAGQRWTVTSIMAGIFSPTRIGIEIPAAELYEGVEFPTSDMGASFANRRWAQADYAINRATRMSLPPRSTGQMPLTG